MQLTNEHKKTMLVFGVGILLFLLLKPKSKKNRGSLNLTDEVDDPKSRAKLKEPTLTAKDAKLNSKAKNAFAALKGYIAAYNNNEPQSVLDDLNEEFKKEFQVKVYKRKSDGKLVVCDLDGKEILINN
jgi:hypothetical protein